MIRDSTWEWNGAAWEQVANDGVGSRSNAALAYDSARRMSVLYGGYNTNTGQQLSGTFGFSCSPCPGDYNGDGMKDIWDVIRFLDDFSADCN